MVVVCCSIVHAVVGVVVVCCSIVIWLLTEVVVARACSPVCYSQRERSVVGALAPVAQCRVLVMCIARAVLELVVREQRRNAVPLELDPQVAAARVFYSHVDRDRFDHEVHRAGKLRGRRLDPVLGAVVIEQRLAARRRVDHAPLGAPRRPGRRALDGGKRVDEPKAVLVAVLDARHVRGPLAGLVVLVVEVSPRGRGQDPLDVAPR